MAEFVMPILGANMEAGTLTAWKKQVGDRVKRGEIIALVETDKANVDVEVFQSGIVEKLLVEPGQKVPVGTPLAVIGEETPAAAAAPALNVPEPGGGRATKAPPAPARQKPGGPRIRITPSARELARKLGVDITAITGSGPDGRIMRRDIERATAAIGPSIPLASAEREERMRRAIAAAMEQSAREIPQYQLSTTIDMSQAMEWLAQQNERRTLQDRLLPVALFIRAVSKALLDAPAINASWKDGRVIEHDSIHVGVAIFLRGGGLVAPAILDADKKNLDELMRGFQDLVQRARAGALRSSEMSDPTITITSLGDQGVETVYGLVVPPQAAIVGFGRIVEGPRSVRGGVVSRPIVIVTLSADHRVTDGHIGARFLNAIDRLLQAPGDL